MKLITAATSIAAALVFGCGGSTQSELDAPQAADSAGQDSQASQLPSWMLEDVQPNSPRTGQTYGLSSFNNKIIVVTLLEGF